MQWRILCLRAAALSFPLLIGPACGDDQGGSPTEETFLVRGHMSRVIQLVVVSNDGVWVGDATVTVNGQLADADGAGGYVVGLPAELPTGGELSVVVEAGGETITAVGVTPESPAVTGPADGGVILTTEPVEVTWTSSTDPDRFQVVVVGADVKEFDAGGTVRAYSIPAGEIVAGEWEIRLYAFNEETFTGSVESGSFMQISNVGGVMDQYPRVTIVTPVLVVGSDMGNRSQQISISQSGTVVDGAALTVNGEAAFQSAPGANYEVTLAVPVAVGGPLDLDLSFASQLGSVVIQGSGSVPESPVVTAPADESSIAVTSAIDVTWTSTTDPERFVVSVDIGPTLQFDVAGNVRAYTLPAGTLPVGGPWQIRVYAYNDGSFTGPVDAESAMNIRGEGTGYPDVTVTP